MAGEAEYKRRQLVITKALMLGYTFHWDERGMEQRHKGVMLLLPDRKYHTVFEHRGHGIHGHSIVVFPALWVAATKALELSGVLHETKSQRDTGTGSGKNFRLRSQRHERARARRIAESSSPRSR
jgi:hypothetical protein